MRQVEIIKGGSAAKKREDQEFSGKNAIQIKLKRNLVLSRFNIKREGGEKEKE